ncbi:MAG: hypothetical protein WCG33_02560 [Actinomycetes bacterium]
MAQKVRIAEHVRTEHRRRLGQLRLVRLHLGQLRLVLRVVVILRQVVRVQQVDHR